MARQSWLSKLSEWWGRLGSSDGDDVEDSDSAVTSLYRPSADKAIKTDVKSGDGPPDDSDQASDSIRASSPGGGWDDGDSGDPGDSGDSGGDGDSGDSD